MDASHQKSFLTIKPSLRMRAEVNDWVSIFVVGNYDGNADIQSIFLM